MKKGLLGLVVIALTVVGCQNYDDQFDDLNKKIASLSSDVTNLSSISASVAALDQKLTSLQGSALTDSDLAGILSEIAELETAVESIDNSAVEAEVADLNNEIDTILERLGDILAANAFYEGNLTITNLGQLANAHEEIKTGADDPTITVKGDVLVLVSSTGVTKDSIASVNSILAKLRSVQGTVTITTDANADLPALTYVTGNVTLDGNEKAAITAAKILTIDGNMTIKKMTGALSYPTLGSVGVVTLPVQSSKVTTTEVNFAGLTGTSGPVQTSTASLVLAKATTVNIGGILPAYIKLDKCTSFTNATGGSQTNLDLTLGGTAATMSLGSTKFTGTVTITTKGNINLPNVTEVSTTTLILNTASSEAHLPALTTIKGDLDISSNATTVDLTALKDLQANLDIDGVVAVSLPALAKLTSRPVTITCIAATSFSAPKLDTGNASGTAIDLKSAVDHITVLNLADTTTPTNDIVEWAATKKITVMAQKGDLSVASATALVDLEFTGFKNTPTAEDAQTNTLLITGANTNIKTVVIGSSSALKTLTVTGTTLTALSTAGEIINVDVTNNDALETFTFGHTHLQGDRESTVTIHDNDDAKFKTVDMSTLSKVGTVVVTENDAITSLVAPSTSVLATSLATITLTISGNKLPGTYTRATAPTGTVTYSAPVINSATLSSFKAWINANVNVDIAAPTGADRTIVSAAADLVQFAQDSNTGPNHGGVTGNAVIFDMDLDEVDDLGSATVTNEKVTLSSLMNGAEGAAARAGATGTAADNDGDNAGGVTSHRELATIAD